MTRYVLIIFLILVFPQYKLFGQIVPIKDANKSYNEDSNQAITSFDFSVFNEDINLLPATLEESIEDDQPFIKVEKMPSFQGGDISTFRAWVQKKANYPQIALENNISGRVLLMFVVERDGSLTGIQVLQSPDSSLSDEAIRVLKTSPMWEPGMQRDKPVRVKYTLPVDFQIRKGPEFIVSGVSSFSEWIQNKLGNPRPSYKGYFNRVSVKFFIEADGSIGDIQVLETPNESLSKKAITALKSSPKWVPGEINGKPTKMHESLSIYFK